MPEFSAQFRVLAPERRRTRSHAQRDVDPLAALSALHSLKNNVCDLVGLRVEREVSGVSDLDEGHLRSPVSSSRSKDARPMSSFSPKTTHARTPVSQNRFASEPRRSRYAT